MVAIFLMVFKVTVYFCCGYLIGQWVSFLFNLPQLALTGLATCLSVSSMLVFEEQIVPKLKSMLR